MPAFLHPRPDVYKRQSLLEGKAVPLKGCKSKTTGKTFDCKAKLKKDGTIEPMFDSKPKGKYNKARR